ncbi:Pentatricopeptide repeat-containing protein At3g62470, mitochondrial [Linum perenne]
MEALKWLEIMKEKGCCPSIRFLTLALEECRKRNDVETADLVWGTVVGGFGIEPDARMYNLMIVLYSCSRNTERAVRLIDEMVCKGVLPDVQGYNVLLEFLIESRRLNDASALLNELVRNDCIPSRLNCSKAVGMFLESGDGDMAKWVWEVMERSYKLGLEETGNLLVVGLINLRLVREAVVYAESMIDKGIKLDVSTISVLKNCLAEGGEELVYEELLRKWKSSLSEIETM